MAFLDFLKSLRQPQGLSASALGGGLMQPTPGLGDPFSLSSHRVSPALEATIPNPANPQSRLGAGLAAIGKGLASYQSDLDDQHKADMALRQQMAAQARSRLSMARPQQIPIMQIGQLPGQAGQAQTPRGGRFGNARQGGLFNKYRGG